MRVRFDQATRDLLDQHHVVYCRKLTAAAARASCGARKSEPANIAGSSIVARTTARAFREPELSGAYLQFNTGTGSLREAATGDGRRANNGSGSVTGPGDDWMADAAAGK